MVRGIFRSEKNRVPKGSRAVISNRGAAKVLSVLCWKFAKTGKLLYEKCRDKTYCWRHYSFFVNSKNFEVYF